MIHPNTVALVVLPMPCCGNPFAIGQVFKADSIAHHDDWPCPHCGCTLVGRWAQGTGGEPHIESTLFPLGMIHQWKRAGLADRAHA